MTAVVPAIRDGRDLLDHDTALFDRLAQAVAREHNVSIDYAERVVDQALAFLATAATTPGDPLGPSAVVDWGWHAFILETHAYADFCERIATRFLHHVPDGAGGASAEPGERTRRTVAAITAAGYRVDHELWMETGDCGPCHEEGNCHASGADGNENTETRRK
ncbi:hypothetical protein V5P93_007258 [Actinokineospora auranticolor]|uniref:Uncharacterized protein n=1 Tax=Actinokineospora auranticolor TaxID=155976 RepID=A0A2S6GRW8_9PSEU|nr:hypothetical protein [Actinokineospora auranticolor]PPK67913.1 hypothetical protein CLV40_106144 [Actinokineospora auranticolor]